LRYLICAAACSDLTQGGMIEAFSAAAADCATLSALGGLLTDAARELGFDHIALRHHGRHQESGPARIAIDSYPVGWKAFLQARRFGTRDPVHQACRRTATGFAWDRIGTLTRLTPRQQALFHLAPRHGLGAGFTVPAHVPGEPAGSCSFVVRAGRALPRHSLLLAEQLGLHAFEAARRLYGFPISVAAPPHLSRREREVLRLVAAGKTDWEVSRVLGLGHETVRQYVKRARSAYDVATRTQLAVHALRDGTIAFDEAIPP
jgi:LuxR family quorum-sensing system transcriptional regulator CciR